MPTGSALMRDHFHNLQALRGVACLMVVLFHLYDLERGFTDRPTLVFREVRWFGFAGVDLFFVLSGFLITATNRRNMGRPSAVPGYLFRRLWRIYPTYWVAFAVTVGVMWALGGNKLFTPDMARSWQWWVLLAPCSDPNAFVAPAWTLSYEVMFYLAFGLLLFGPPRLAALGLAAWAAAVGWKLTGPEPSSPVGKLVVSPFVLEFLGGALVAWLTARGVRGWWRTALLLGVAYAAVGVCVTTALTTQRFLDLMGGPRLRVLLFGPPAVLIVYAFVASEGKWRVPRWLLRTGDASYSLYLIHPLVLFGGKYVGFLVSHNRVPHLLWLSVTFAATLVVGFAMYALVERPLLNLGRKKRPARPEAAPAPGLPLAA